MISLAQFKSLPDSQALNPFHRLLVKFSRFKAFSFEILFTLEAFMLRYAWAGLCLLLTLVLPPLEEVAGLRFLACGATLIYPAFFLWSLTRLSGVELVQLILDGRWTGEILATPLENRDFTRGFISPLWIIVRQYFLITVFSLALYALEKRTLIMSNGHVDFSGLLLRLATTCSLFFSASAWLVFIYLARLLLEVRLRNGLLKGLITVALMLAGVAGVIIYGIVFFRYTSRLDRLNSLSVINTLTLLFLCATLALHVVLRHNFRRYLEGHFDLDPIIFDHADPHASGWQKMV